MRPALAARGRHLRTENTTADTIIFDGLLAGYLAKSALDHALSAA